MEAVMSSKSPKAKQRESKSKESAIVKPMLKTGLPPGINPQEAKDPGSTSRSKRVKNDS
jgi:hypothetical protein